MEWVYVIGIVILAFILMIGISQLMIMRAVKQVIKTMKKYNATSLKNALSDSDMKLQPRSFLQGLGRVRDYKPQAIMLLENLKVVRRTEDGKLYLSEDDLAKSRWKGV